MADDKTTCVFCGSPFHKTHLGPLIVIAEHKIPDLPLVCPLSLAPSLEVDHLADRMKRKQRKLNGEQ